ncbi:mitochondrial adenyl nucleotide antiporter SLC25A25-like isoform X2 [Culicoides brevitarsis]|uniref:mitochondrial adenyl nucleotide antiporter SLC25A25-like isoform X2 n=1 Tax=Culicoides brevitarsis TaxID=469753 RepID=UPI00307B8673
MDMLDSDFYVEIVIRYLDGDDNLELVSDLSKTEIQTGVWWKHLVAGGFAGAISRSCTAPLDRLKVFLQVQTSKRRIFECFGYMYKEGGIKSFWRGNGINVLKIAPESAIKFSIYEHMKRLIRGDQNRYMNMSERFLAGSIAGGVSQTIIYPLEVLKTRLTLSKTGQYSSIIDAVIKMYTQEGFLSFYRGYIPNMLGILPYAGIDLCVYETLKRKYVHNTKTEPRIWVLLLCGGTSSTLAIMGTYPLALVRTRLQARFFSSSPQISNGNLSDSKMTAAFKHIIKTEGITGLYRGILPNFIKVLPAVSISYVVYEYLSKSLGIKMT